MQEGEVQIVEQCDDQAELRERPFPADVVGQQRQPGSEQRAAVGPDLVVPDGQLLQDGPRIAMGNVGGKR